MSKSVFDTREAWLLSATDRLRVGLFKPIGEDLPAVKVSVGFPGGGSARKRVGEHWHPKSTDDGVSQVFISPTVSSPTDALQILVHELIHALYPDAGHKGAFRRVAVAIGLRGPMKSTKAGPELQARLEKLAGHLGDYPHAGINLNDRKKQSTRLLKLECPNCGYGVWTTNRWISQGLPICPSHPETLNRVN